MRDYEKTEFELEKKFNSIWFRVWTDKKITWFSVKNDLNGPNISELFSYSTASYIKKNSNFVNKLDIEDEYLKFLRKNKLQKINKKINYENKN